MQALKVGLITLGVFTIILLGATFGLTWAVVAALKDTRVRNHLELLLSWPVRYSQTPHRFVRGPICTACLIRLCFLFSRLALCMPLSLARTSPPSPRRSMAAC